MPPASNISVERILLIAYFSVATILLLRILVPMAALQRVCQRSSRADRDIQMLEQTVAHELGLQRVPRVLTSAQTSVPFVAGVLRPRIVLPVSMMAGLSRQAARFVLAHETAHIAGGDVGWSLIAKVLQVILWPHPLIWRVTAAHRHACETLCDGIAAGTGNEPKLYLQTLARLALQLQEGPLPDGAITMFSRSEISRRLDRIALGIRSEPLRAVPQLAALLAAVIALSVIATVGGDVARAGLESAKAQSTASESPANTEELKPGDQADESNAPAAPVWNESKAKATWIGHNDFVYAIAFSPDGKTLASGGQDGAIKLWDLSTRKVRFALGKTEPINSLTYFPDGTKLATATHDAIRIWDASNGAQLSTFKLNLARVASLAISEDGKTLAMDAVQARNRFAKLWDLPSGTNTATFERNDLFLGSIVFDPNGDAVAPGSFKGSIRLWDIATGKALATMQEITSESLVYFTSTGDKLISVRLSDGTIHQWDYVSGKIVATIQGREQISSAALSPDGRMLATTSSRTIRLWDLATGKNVATLRGHSPPIWKLAFSPDGRILASASVGTLQLWDVKEAIAAPQQLVDLSIDRISDSLTSLDSKAKASQVSIRYVLDPEVKKFFGEDDLKRGREEFRKAIISTIEPWTWTDAGGKDTAVWDDDGLIVLANRRTIHPKFESLAHILNRTVPPSFTFFESAEHERIQSGLSNLTQCNFRRVPLNEAATFLGSLHNFNIVVDAKSLSEAGIKIDTPITFQMKGEPLGATLDKMLEPLKLDYAVRNEVLTIMSRKEAAEVLETRIYVLKRLLKDGVNPSRVIDHITTTVAPASWSAKGGRGTIAMLPGYLLVYQSPRNLRQIEKTLGEMK